MQKHLMNQSLSLSFTFILVFGGIGSVVLTTQKVTVQVVVGVIGIVEWKPERGTRFNQVSSNMTLRQGSLLRLSQGGSVTISCANGRLTTWTTQGTSGLTQICSPPRTVSGRVITPRNGERDIPYAILPRGTAILSNQPVLRWNASVGANRFTLTVRGQGLKWTTQLNKADVCRGQTCEFMYPGEPPLQPGTSYRFVIDADNRRSSEEERTVGLGFKLLNAVDATEVRQTSERIKAQNIPDVSKAVALANLYISYNLISESIQTLEMIPKLEKTAEAHRQLGDIYRLIGLPLEAEVQYREAIANATNNPFEFVSAQVGLGEVKYSLGGRDEAVRLFQDAKAEYERLGDIERVAELEQRLATMR